MTVLEQPAIDPRDRAIRWRQLVDLVARAGTQAQTPLVQRALEVIRSDGVDVDEGLRAAAARAVAALPLPFGLLELFASDRLAVSAPLLAAANLEPAEWSRLIAAADEETDRKSTRLNSSHANISYAVFCLKKKKLRTTSRTSSPWLISTITSS